IKNEKDIKAKIGNIISCYCYRYGKERNVYYYEIEVERDKIEDNGMF
ncbi:22010_t:CDS:1, partial [Gigaspora margarita]